MTEPTRDTMAAEAATLDRELGEIDMLIAQATAEAARHEQKRATAAEKLATLASSGADPKEQLEHSSQLVTLTRRAALMEAQVEVLEGKRKALARFRDALGRYADVPLEGGPDADAGPAAPDDGATADDGAGPIPPALSRIVLSAQEDLRREIARAMHDGPAQSLTNIVLQAQIVERLLATDTARARTEVGLLISMVQQTLDATKSFIFDVRPMVLDDLGLVPTLRRAARDRGRRAGIPVNFETAGPDRRLTMEVESGLFRIIDEALAAFLSVSPATVSLTLDWSDGVEATVAARRGTAEEAAAAAAIAAAEAEESVTPAKGAKELPPALAAMMEDRRADRKAAAERAKDATIAALPANAWREIQQRAATLGITVELLEGGGSLRVGAPLPEVVPAEESA
jgi:two-component system sensor histidine kinase DegS